MTIAKLAIQEYQCKMKVSGTDLRLLRVFDTVARHGGFAAAQAELNVSQSTISNHITALEERLGVSLCQRGRSGFRLTEKGQIVFFATQRLLVSLDQFSSEVGAIKGQLVGELKIGLVDAIVSDPFCKIDTAIALFKSRPNDVTIHITQESPQNLQEKVLTGELQIGIGSFPHKIAGLSYEPLYTEAHGLYCGRHHHLFDVEDSDIDIRELQKEEIASRGYWREQFQKNLGFKNITASVYQIEPQLILIKSGKLLGFLPHHFAQSWVASGDLRQLAPAAVSYTCTFDLIVKKGYHSTQVIEAFLADIRKSQKNE